MTSRVVVVGAGIGGLAAAIALRQAGCEVTVLERAAGPADGGAGITLFRNALIALEALRVAGDVRAIGRPVAGGAALRPDGSRLTRPLDPQDVRRAGAELLALHRADLHAVLRAALPDVTVRTNEEVVDVRNGSVVLKDGEEVAADRIVGADGARSVVRHRLWPDAPPVRYAGFTAWRGVTDRPLDVETASETWGRGAEFGIVPLRDGRLYCYATANEPEGSRAADEKAEVRRRFASWHPPIADIIDATAAVLRHDIFQRPRPYPSFVKGRVALLGDAAHAMCPNAGQGACQALEDAVTLARLGPAGYDRARRRRTQRIAAISARSAAFVQGNPGVRDVAARMLPPTVLLRAAGRLTRWTVP